MAKLTTSVCVAVDHKYSDNNGHYMLAWLWDGETVTKAGGMYCMIDYEVNATAQQIKDAGDWLKNHTPAEATYNKYAAKGMGAVTFVGCVVTLARSRKAPNKVPLTVVGFQDRYYNGYHWVDEKITVKDENGNTYEVAKSCIKDLIQGVQDLPFWVE